VPWSRSRIQKLGAGLFHRSLRERRRRTDQALFTVVMEARIDAVTARRTAFGIPVGAGDQFTDD
jgi:hypothetical protein